jgi:hypothetical protein
MVYPNSPLDLGNDASDRSGIKGACRAIPVVARWTIDQVYREPESRLRLTLRSQGTWVGVEEIGRCGREKDRMSEGQRDRERRGVLTSDWRQCVVISRSLASLPDLIPLTTQPQVRLEYLSPVTFSFTTLTLGNRSLHYTSVSTGHWTGEQSDNRKPPESPERSPRNTATVTKGDIQGHTRPSRRPCLQQDDVC